MVKKVKTWYCCPYCHNRFEDEEDAEDCKTDCENYEHVYKKELELFVCETCKKDYKTEKEATECEYKHLADHPNQTKLVE